MREWRLSLVPFLLALGVVGTGAVGTARAELWAAEPPLLPLFGPCYWLLPGTLVSVDLCEIAAPPNHAPRPPVAPEEPWALLVSPQVLRESETADDEPSADSKASLKTALQMPLAGPLFVFGQVGSEEQTANPSGTTKVDGRTGLGCKIGLLPGTEVSLRTGPTMSYVGSRRTEHGLEHSPLLVEMQCRCPLLGPAGLEYVGSAIPALDPTERDRLNQDLRVVVPLTNDWSFRIGAKHSWQNTPDPQPLSTGLQFYVGSGVKW